jgi:MYXO-CTERM domain-containing protein
MHNHRSSTALLACAITAVCVIEQAQAKFIGVIVQDITSNSYGLSEYAVYAEFDDPLDEVFLVFNANIISTTGFFHNSIDGAGQSALPFTADETAMSDFPEADSFVTIGLPTGDNNATMLTFGFDERSFIVGNNIGSNVGWVNGDPFNDAGLAGPDGLVLLGVFTPTNDATGAPGIVSGTITIGYAPDPESPTASFVTPAPGSLALLGLAALLRSRRRRQPVS